MGTALRAPGKSALCSSSAETPVVGEPLGWGLLLWRFLDSAERSVKKQRAARCGQPCRCRLVVLRLLAPWWSPMLLVDADQLGRLAKFTARLMPRPCTAVEASSPEPRPPL